MVDVAIVSAYRTPIGTFGGVFKEVSALELGKAVVEKAIDNIKLEPSEVDEVVFGNIYSTNLGPNITRQIAIHSGIPDTVPAYTINKLCGSGLKAVELGAQAIRAGDAEVVITGGTENMSQSPYILPHNRWGQKMGDGQVIDSMLKDGLVDPFHNYHMGVTAENIVEKYGFTREQQDKLAVTSQNRAEKAIENGRFKDEIVPVQVPQRKGDALLVVTDEHPRKGVTLEGLSKARPAFKKGGTVTAPNSSGINDGAAAVILMSKEKAEQLGIEPLAMIKSYASAGVDPKIMGCGPIPATEKALKKAGLTIDDLDLIEANEAFAAQALSVITDLKLNTEIVNVNGGAIALGHPVGASGARILVTLLYEMKKRNSKTGLATLCIGGGQGTSLIVER